MREIKFRAWDKKENKMVCWKDIARTNILGMLANNNNRDDSNATLMQFTGLLDKNGVEIYEGDIVKNSLNDILEIEWNEDRCCFEMRGRYENSHKQRQLDCDIVIDLNIKVIGNIYENHELLEAQP